MNRWDVIEHAAADRRANDLRTAKLAHQLHASGIKQPKQSWWRTWLNRRSATQEPTNVAAPTDAIADAPAKA